MDGAAACSGESPLKGQNSPGKSLAPPLSFIDKNQVWKAGSTVVIA